MKKVYLLLSILSIAHFIQSQDNEPPEINFSGSVDVYYHSKKDAPATAFGNLNGFALGMINLKASSEQGPVGFVGDLVFGPRGRDAVFGSVGSSNIINQLYTYLNVSDRLTLTLGNFNTFVGYEVISPTQNFNYSTSYLFSYGPFSHTGLKADVDLGNGLSLMIGVLNQTDATEFQPSEESYYGGVQLGYEFNRGSIWLNSLMNSDFVQLDLTAGMDITETLYMGVNGSIAQDAFSGAVLYAQLSATDDFGVGVRAEYFVEKTSLGGLEDELPIYISGKESGSIWEFTLSANYKVGALTIIPEFRVDLTDEIVHNDSKSLSSFTLAAVYGF